ncbi:hypothetical protein [Sphingobium xenophagum]|uniref:LPD3 domain-containing protein n=1 Tax=Sphingobium xenophagum TaxID=121428 RepID=UPI0003729CC5|nr:hypothetical protein [Sphingobium xenophagum]
MSLIDDIRASQRKSGGNNLLDAIRAESGGKPDSPAMRSIVTARAPMSAAEARTRDTADREVADARQGDGFADRMSDLFVRGARGLDAGLSRAVSVLSPFDAVRSTERGAAQQFERVSGAPVAGEQTWEMTKANPSVSGLGRFVLDQSVGSAPGMIVAASGIPGTIAYGVTQAGNIGQQRAENDGRGDATLSDVAAATPAAAASALLERVGIGGIFGATGRNAITRIGKAAATEGVTEFGQSIVENAGGTLGTERGFSASEALDQGVAGAVAGVGMGGALRATEEGGGAAYAKWQSRPEVPGIRDVADQSVEITPEDVASPIPTDIIAKGKAELARAGVGSVADDILSTGGVPTTGKRVAVQMPGGETMTGTVQDAIDTDAGTLGRAQGVKIAMDDGSTFAEHFDTIRDAGVKIEELSPLAEADALDAQLRQRAQEPLQVAPEVASPAPVPQTTAKPQSSGPKGTPVGNAKAITEELFPDAVVTSWARGKDDPLSKANPKSWHAKSKAAVDVRPIKGVTFEQFVQRYKDQGYTILEALNETGAGKTKHATGDHWHIVLGERSGDQREAPAPPPQSTLIEEARASQAPENQGRDLRGDTIDKEWVRFAPETGTLDVPRAEMPQVAAEHRGALVNFLGARGIAHEEQTVPADSLKPTQAEFSTAKVAKAKAFTGGDRAILVSSDGHVVDGHHQWIAKRDAGQDVRVIKLDAPIRDLLEIVPEMPSATTDSGGTPASTVKQDLTVAPVAESSTPAPQISASPAPERGVQSSTPQIEDMPSGKSVIIKGATAEQLAAVRSALPEKVQPLENAKLGGIVYSKKHEAKIRDALAKIERDAAAAARSVLRRPVVGPTPTSLNDALDTLRQMRAAERIDEYDSSRNHAAHVLSTINDKGIEAASKLAASTLSTKQRLNANEQRAFEIVRDASQGNPSPSSDGPVTDARRAATSAAAAKLSAAMDKAGAEAPSDSVTIVSVDATPLTNYGSKNRLVSADRAAELRARLKSKMQNLNAGVDPEALAIGIELAIFHIEAGARKFADFVKAIHADIRDMGEEPNKMRPYLRGWYNGARDTMEDQGEDVSDLDGPGAVRAAFSMLSEGDATQAPAPATAASETTDGIQGSLPRSDAPASAADVQRAAPQRSDGSPSSGQVERGTPPVRATDSGRGQDTERGSARSGRAERGGATGSRNADRLPATGNWRIEPGSLDESRSAATKAADNLAAIEIIKALDADGRKASASEQAALSRYVGWGGLKNAFPDSDGNYGKGFEEIGPRLRALLTDEEYDTARRSIQYAHYTSETIVRSMWSMARQFGFTGGLVFEPGMGTGNFAGMMPGDIAAATQYQGIEYDRLTARIAENLYPKWGVRQADYTRIPGAKDTYDLVIGNPPFSETVVSADPEYAGKGFVLHDYFFAKSLDAVRPGGLLMFVTSAGTMNKVSMKAREYLAARAELVGAVRLPDNAFEENAGTSVTTDIVVLRKLLPGEDVGDRTWTETVDRELPDRDGGTKTGAVSRYFSENPDMVLGEEGYFDKLVAGTRYAVRAPKGFDLKAALADAAARLPSDVMTRRVIGTDAAVADFDLGATERKDGSFYVGADGRLMQMRGNVGKPVERQGKGVKGGISAAAQERIINLLPIRDALRTVYSHDLAGNATEADKARASLNKAYDRFVAKFGPINKAEISYRRPTIIQQESARAQMREEERLAGREWREGSFDATPMIEAGARTSEIARAREDARAAAVAAALPWDEGTFDPAEMPDVIVDKRPNIEAFMDDQEGYRLRAIEHYNDDTGEARKGLVFYENVITKERTPTIRSAQDALLYAMNKVGRPDLALIADAAGLSQADALAELGDAVFMVPGQDGHYQTRAQYLSGNVRQKLESARAEAKRDDRFERNVRALEAVQPADLGPADIAANLGMPWLPAEIITEFGKHLGLSNFKASYMPKLAQWFAAGDMSSAAATTTWGTPARSAPDLISDALNRQTPKIYVDINTPDGKKRVMDETATQAAQDKVNEIKIAFREWVWSDETRTRDLVALYNRDYNNLVAPAYDGDYLTTPGIAATWSWRPHQTAVISRIIQAGNTYMAHEVGAGKTSAMIGSGMEMRRLGLVRKPMYVVPNHMLGQFTKEFYEQYPTARIAVADERQFHTSRRKQFIANIAADDLDAVIITHSAFGFIGPSDEFVDGIINDELIEYRAMLNEIPKGDQEARFTRRRIEQKIEQLEQRLSGKSNRKRDDVFTFEETGVDFLFVDEAHLFRKLDFATKMSNIKGIDPSGSKMSFDLFAKVRYLESQRPGRSVVLASGTPITNTMAELYSVSRYLQMDELEARGLAQFDAWAGAYGDTSTALEQDPAGGYKSVTRFAKFVNVPELSTMVRQVMDVVTGADLERYVTRPKLKGGNRQMTVVPQTSGQQAYQKQLAARMKLIQSRKGPPKPGDDILLSVIGDGRKSAIDYRLIDASAPKEASKLEAMVDRVYRIWQDTKRQPFHAITSDGYSSDPVDFGPATQMVFSDFGINGDFPVQKYVAAQLQRRGVPKGEVAIISDYKSHVARQRLFNDMNDGKVRVLIGSVAKMGTGVNAQKRLYALHNMDAQWYPANDQQRNGRIIRQGNMNPEIEIHDYSTKGTYDSTMWGLMETKARFIEGFMRGDPTMRDMDDLGEASQYEQAKALTTNDPRIQTLTEWRQELEKMQRRRTAFDREMQSVRSRISQAEYYREEATARIPHIQADIAQRTPIDGDSFTAAAGGKTFDKREDFGEALLAAMDDIAGKGRAADAEPVKIGEVGGFAIVGDVFHGPDGLTPRYYVRRNGGYETRIKDVTNARGLVTKISNVLAGFEGELSALEAQVEANAARIEEFTPQLDRKFTGAATIRELRGKIDEMESTLAAETQAGQSSVEAKASIPEDSEPVTVLTGNEMGVTFTGPDDYPALVKAASAWYKKNLVGKTIMMADGVPVTFNTRGMRETTERRGDYLLRAIPAIPDILAKGRIMPGAAGDRLGIVKVTWVAAKVRVADRDLNVMLSVREHTDGKSRQYSLHALGGVGGRFSQTEGATESGPEWKSPPTSFNIFLQEPDGNGGGLDFESAPDASATDSDAGRAVVAANEIRDALSARLDAMGIKDKVTLRVVQRFEENGFAAGLYRNGVISVAMQTSQTPMATLNHETIHFLRDTGLFLAPEWTSLVAAARADKAMMASVARRYPHLDEDSQVEEAVADRFKRFASGEDARGFAAKAHERIRDFIRALGDALRGLGFTTADGVMRAIERGEIGARDPAMPSRTSPARASIPAAATFDSPETEARYQKAKDGVASVETFRERVAAFMDTAWHGMSRHWIALPNEPRYSALQQKLRGLEAAPQAAKERTVRMLEEIVKDFTPGDLDLFTRKVILDDLSWDAANERDLPFGLTAASVKSEKAKVDAILQADPDQKVWKAAMKRKLANRTIANDLVAAGVLEAEQIKNPAYYRHQVLEYARAEQKRAAGVKGVGARLRTPKWAKRMGSSLDINANLLEAEFDWLNKAFTDIPIANGIEWIKRSEHNILESLKAEATASNKKGVAAALAKAEDTIANSRDPEEIAKAAELIEQEKYFRQRVAMGFDVVRQAIESNQLKPPVRFDAVADAIVTGRSNTNEPPFAFLTWILDNGEAGAMGAAMIFKGIGQRRTWTKKTLGQAYIDPLNAEELVKRLAPEGYRTWQPEEGKLLFTAKTLPEHAIDRMLEKLDAPAGIDPTEFRAALEQTRNLLVVGGDRYKMILPDEVADTLNNLKRVDLEGLYDFLVLKPVRAWKRWVLINPRRFLKYNINNLTGDLDAILAGNPRTLRHVGRVGRELASVMRGKAQPSARYEEAVARGVFDSGISVQEIPDLHAFAPFERFAQNGRRIDKIAMLPLRRAWGALQGATQWRENVFRYAAYLDYVERLEAGVAQSEVGYGASIPKMVDAVPDKKDRAALLARDLIGDYGAISHFGGGLRKTIIPFWSWMEINTRRYWRLSSNAYSQGIGRGIATGGGLALAAGVRHSAWLAVRAGMVYGLIQLWNELFFSDEEDDLGEEQKRQLHIILGRNDAGEVVTLRTQGALSDAMSWFGIGDTVSAFKEYERGRATLGEVLAQPLKAPINKVGTALSPALTIPLESATGKKLWPDLFNTRVNRDPWRNALSAFSLENEYDAAMEKPSRGYARSWQEAVLYRRDPGEIAYNEARGIAYAWLEDVKGQSGSSSFSTPRSEALRDYRTALRFGDQSAADKAIDEMIALGMNDKDLAGSIKRAAPLGPIAKKDRAEFVAGLTDQEVETFAKAEEWYGRTFK